MNPKDLMREYKYGYVFSKNLLENQFVRDLLKEIKDLEFIVGLRQKRNLIRKFDKEYDKKDKKKNPNRNYAGIVPDAEEVYKRYYKQKEIIDRAIEYIESKVFSSGEIIDQLRKIEVKELLNILKGEKYEKES